jgi:hypothetical protein
MAAPAQALQHNQRLGGIARLAQEDSLEHHNGVGGENDAIRPSLLHGLRLRQRQEAGYGLGPPVGTDRLFVDIRRIRFKNKPGPAQQVPAPR